MIFFTESLRYVKYLTEITPEELADPFTRFHKVKDAQGEQAIEIRRNNEYELIYKCEIETLNSRERIASEKARRQRLLAAAAAAAVANKLVSFESL